MQKDYKIREMISELASLCNEYLIYCKGFNECAFSDRLLEKVFYKTKKIEKIHNNRFKNRINSKGER